MLNPRAIAQIALIRNARSDSADQHLDLDAGRGCGRRKIGMAEMENRNRDTRRGSSPRRARGFPFPPSASSRRAMAKCKLYSREDSSRKVAGNRCRTETNSRKVAIVTPTRARARAHARVMPTKFIWKVERVRPLVTFAHWITVFPVEYAKRVFTKGKSRTILPAIAPWHSLFFTKHTGRPLRRWKMVPARIPRANSVLCF